MTIKIKEEKGLVSIIIPTYNRKKDLDICLQTILSQTYTFVEIMVVDDNSSDETVNYIRKKHPDVLILINKNNQGPNYSINRGVVNSTGEFILILDSDVELTNKDQITNMVKVMNSNLKIGSIGGCYLSNDKKIRACGLKRSVVSDLEYSSKQETNLNSLKECDWIAGNNLFTKKRLFYEVGGFDELSKGEDTELAFGLNLRKKGYINLFGPPVALKHLQSETERNNVGLNSNLNKNKNKLRLIWRYRNRIRYVIKNNSDINKEIKNHILSENFVKLGSQLLLIIFFIKQQFLGLRNKNTKELPSFKIKIKSFNTEISTLFFTIRIIFDSFFWNLFHLNQTLHYETIHSLNKKRFDRENE